jgi:putative salt-induced outer membrane protein YdiY
MRHCLVLAILLTLLMLPTAGHAATVTLANGDQLTGQVVEQTADHLRLKHPVLGEVELAMAGVDAIEGAAGEASAKAKTAGQATPTPWSNSEGQAVAKNSGQGEAEQAANQQPDPKTAQAKADKAESTEPKYWEATVLPKWEKSLALGFSGTEGNSDNQSLNAQFQLKKKTDAVRLNFNNRFFYATSNDKTTQNEFNSELTTDFLKPESPWFIFTQTSYEYDEFEPWRHRVGGYIGPGYTFVERDDLELVGRVGAGGNYEFGEVNELTPEALLGSEVLTWKITDHQTLTGKATLYPDLEATSEFRLVSSAEWKVKINRAEGLSLKFGVENEYESITKGPSEHNDLKYYGALDYAF